MGRMAGEGSRKRKWEEIETAGRGQHAIKLKHEHSAKNKNSSFFFIL